MRSPRGFTLIELVISLTLVMLVALTLFASLRGALKAWNRGSNRIAASVRMRIGTDLIRKQMACVSQVTYPVEVAAGMRGQPVPFFRGESQHVEFISLSALRFQENPGLTLVTYYLENQGGHQFLAESERRYLGADSIQQPFANAAPIPIVEDVADIQFRYLEKIEDPPMSGNIIYNWVDMWDGELRNELPQAIELQVKMQNFGTSYATAATTPQDLRIVVPIQAKPVNLGFGGRRPPFGPNNPNNPRLPSPRVPPGRPR